MEDAGLVRGRHESGGGASPDREEHNLMSGAVSSSGSSNAEATEPASSSKRTQAQASLCSSSPELNNTSSSESSRSEASVKPGKKRKGNGKKLDRSKLRKGKWTIEEEEYTSRIIHYFSTGLLTLPEGATLRSYLAEKLNCDPMRITKKYAGASCLGRRVYQFRERIHPTMADIQIARTELDHLEQRFRMRVEGDAGGQKVQRSTNTSQALVQPSPQLVLPAPATSQNPIQNILLGLLGAQGAQNPLQMPPFAGAGNTMFPGASSANQTQSMQLPSLPLGQPPAPTSSTSGMPSQLPSNFAPTIAPMPPHLQPQTDQMKAATVAPHIHQITYPQATAPTSGGNPSQDATGQQPGVVDPMLANWALLQAAASLGPALSQLAAANIQQAQQQQQQQQTVPAQSHQPPPPQPQSNPLNPMMYPQQQQHAPPASQVPTPAPSSVPAPDQASQLQAQQLQMQIQEQQAKLQQQLLQLNAAAAAQQPTAAPPKQDPTPQAQHSLLMQPAPTMGSISIDPRSAGAPGAVQMGNPTVVAEHFTKDLKEAYDLHLQTQQQQQQQQSQAAAAAAGKAAPSPVMGGFAALNGLNLSSGMVGNIPTMPQQQPQNGGVAPRSDDERAAGTALLGFLSSLRQSYEDALRDQSIPQGAPPMAATTTAAAAAAGVNATGANPGAAMFKSDSSDERTVTVITDSNAGSNQPDSSVEDSDWNSDKAKTDPSSSEDSDKETPGRASPKRQKVSAEV